MSRPSSRSTQARCSASACRQSSSPASGRSSAATSRSGGRSAVAVSTMSRLTSKPALASSDSSPARPSTESIPHATCSAPGAAAAKSSRRAGTSPGGGGSAKRRKFPHQYVGFAGVRTTTCRSRCSISLPPSARTARSVRNPSETTSTVRFSSTRLTRAGQCREEDSNLRRLSQRVYSPPPLATRESLRGTRL